MLRSHAVVTSCAHCDLPVPKGLIDPEAELQFCCAGCRTVYQMIHSCGLERFYALAEASRERAPARVTSKDYGTLDDHAFLDAYAPREGDGTRTIELYLEGVHCAACVWLVERLPSVVPGVIEARLDFGRRRLHLTWDPERVALSRIAMTLDRLGYPPHPYRGGALDEVRRRETRAHLVRIGVAGACAGNTMLIAFALYGAMGSGMDPAVALLLRSASLVIALISLLGPGRVFLRGAWSAARLRTMHMDVPIALALTAGMAWGAVNTLTGSGEVYFESLTAVIFLLLIGRWLQHRQQQAAQDAVELLHSMTPRTARRVDVDGPRDVAIEALNPGDRVELRAGDAAPADGSIIEGRSTFDLSTLSGESRPVPKVLGDRVHAGTVNVQSRVVIEVEVTGAQTRVGHVAALIERFAAERPPVVRVADRLAHWFVLLVLGVAGGTFIAWALTASVSAGVEHAIALLIVTCPCALGLATPLALQAAIGRTAHCGILVKGGAVLESLACPGLILLDKTGTLTQGRSRVVTWHGDESCRLHVAALERDIAHPIASALGYSGMSGMSGNEHLDGPADVQATGVRHIPGAGATGSVEGVEYVVGSFEFVGQVVGMQGAWSRRAATQCIERGLSPVAIAADGRVVAVAGIGDAIHDDALDSVRRLRKLGWEIGVLSGDHRDIVRAVGEQLELDPDVLFGGCSPEAKAAHVQAQLDRHDTVVMVGDGVNDAAALAVATVGIAVHGGAEASLAAADIFLRREGVGAVVETVLGARRSLRVIRRCLGASLVYNLLTGSLAVVGVINPLIAAVLMPISSLTVVTLAYRSHTFGGGPSCP